MRRCAVIGLVLLAACETTSLEGGIVEIENGSTTHTIRYQVTGGAESVDVTFQNENGDTSQQGDRPLPWTYSFTASEGDFLYVSAQNQGEFGGTKCSIFVDGTEAESNISSGAYTICTASGRL